MCSLCDAGHCQTREGGGGGIVWSVPWSISHILNRYFGSIFQSAEPSPVDSEQWRYPVGSEQWR